ncbi:family with sequence similarity 53 member A [Rhinolophus ferrumequinum]|uniref:Family with sequence similarity 53 member A n=1 Tax=Rhinolophus ferrumequinum TaxID=59479 RepID=A0A7J7ZC22_RHIFE|nr:family with sequence similarity 53 member A [Rhinolophus ferrumequinum]
MRSEDFRPPTMVTLITEKLQNQSLDDLTCKSCGANPTLKNSKSLCSLDYEDDEDDTGAKTSVSSPRDPRDLTGLCIPGSSPLSACPGSRPASPSLWASREPAASEGRSAGAPSDWDSSGEETTFPLDHGELDLEQIESN